MPNGIVIAAVIAIIILGLIVVIQMIAITALLLIIKNLAQEIRERVDPVISKMNGVMATLNDMAQTVQGKTEHIAEKTAQTTDVVADRIEKTSGLMQRAVAAPIIAGSAASQGIMHGIFAWRAARQRRCRTEQAATHPLEETMPITPTEAPEG